MISIRLITTTDLPAVVHLQDSCYGDALYESPELLKRRLAAANNSCWLAKSAQGELLAYLFSYPSLDGVVTPLAAEFTPKPEADVLYLHDMAVSPLARGMGLAGRLLNTATGYAQNLGLHKLALVAVQGSVPFWQHQGFNVVDKTTRVAEAALASYTGEQASYMQKVIKR